MVGQRLGLEPDRADVLPAYEAILVPLSPARNVGRQTLAAYLYRQLLVFDVGGGPADEPVSRRVEVRGYKVIQAPHLRRRTGVLVEGHVREEPVDVGPHLGHEVLAELVAAIAESSSMFVVGREEHQADVLRSEERRVG